MSYVIVAGGGRTGHPISSSKQTETPLKIRIDHPWSLVVEKAGEQGRHLETPSAKEQKPSKSLQRTPRNRCWVRGDQAPKN